MCDGKKFGYWEYLSQGEINECEEDWWIIKEEDRRNRGQLSFLISQAPYLQTLQFYASSETSSRIPQFEPNQRRQKGKLTFNYFKHLNSH